MVKKRKFGRGGTTVNAPSTADVLSGVTAERRDSPDVSVEPKLSKSAARQDMSFGQAFRDARNSGASTFMWRGRSYGTQLAGERSAAPSRRAASSPSPAPTPSRRAASSPSPAPTPSRARTTPAPAPAPSRRAAATPAPAPSRRAAATPGTRAAAMAVRAIGDAATGGLGGAITNAGARGYSDSSRRGYASLMREMLNRRREAEPAAAPTPARARAARPSSNGALLLRPERPKRPAEGTPGRILYRAKGGSVSSRGDGIAKRGKTKGKIR